MDTKMLKVFPCIFKTFLLKIVCTIAKGRIFTRIIKRHLLRKSDLRIVFLTKIDEGLAVRVDLWSG